ncbi:MAG: hypothetical protein U1G07_08320 [Verrucomicrobiota bacterium]
MTRIGTIFPGRWFLYTQPPGVHAWQRMGLIEHLNADRAASGLPGLTTADEEAVCRESVDLFFEPDHILIRPDPDNLALAFAADEELQTIASKSRIHYMSVADVRVREALKKRGEYWRLSSLPKSREGRKKVIFGSKVAIDGLPIYYYNRLTGTRWLTYDEFENLGRLPETELARHLREIADYAVRKNRLGRPELDFFAADLQRLRVQDLGTGDALERMSGNALRALYDQWKAQFRAAVHQSYLRDDFQSRAWCERILSTLCLEGSEVETEQILSGLSPEFFLHLEWLPGGRFEAGEFLVDPVFEEAMAHPEDPDLQRLCDPRAKEIILNFTRDYGDLDYINLGVVAESLSLDRPQKEGRRGVYLAEFYPRNEAEPIRRFLRLQKWSVWEHLDEGKDLLRAILESEEYTDYSLDRRLGCRQLGMHLCRRSVLRRLNEIYLGNNQRYRGQTIRTPYFEREYLFGIATDKLPLERYERPGYAARLANLLGRAAASSLIVGRSLEETRPAFDDGDEVVLEGKDGLPTEILVADHSGAFAEYEQPLHNFAADYARPVNRREAMLPEAVEFARLYLESFRKQFTQVRDDYRMRRNAFDHLFKHCKYDPAGSFAFRWECVLRRLDQTDPTAITEAIRSHIHILK